jgi:hypothetical protein
VALNDIFDGKKYDEYSGYSEFDLASAIVECQDAGGRLSSLVDIMPSGAFPRICQKLYGNNSERYASALRLLATWDHFDDGAWQSMATAERRKSPGS